MIRYDDRRVVQLNEELEEARRMMEDGPLPQVRTKLAELRVRAEALGFSSAYLLWCQRQVADKEGLAEQAFDFACEAVLRDPLHGPNRSAFDEQSWKLRNVLSDPARAVDDPSTPRIYEKLSRAGETDVGCHLAKARFLVAQQQLEPAMELVLAVTLVSPTSIDALELMIDLCELSENTGLEAEYRVKLDEQRGRPVPFAIDSPQATA